MILKGVQAFSEQDTEPSPHVLKPSIIEPSETTEKVMFQTVKTDENLSQFCSKKRFFKILIKRVKIDEFSGVFYTESAAILFKLTAIAVNLA